VAEPFAAAVAPSDEVLSPIDAIVGPTELLVAGLTEIAGATPQPLADALAATPAHSGSIVDTQVQAAGAAIDAHVPLMTEPIASSVAPNTEGLGAWPETADVFPTLTGASEVVATTAGGAAQEPVGSTTGAAAGAGDLLDRGLVPTPQEGRLGSVLDALAGTTDPIAGYGLDASDQRLLVTTGIVVGIGITLTPAGLDTVRATCSANASLVFSNVRLLPCVAEEAVRRYASAATEVLTRPVSGGRGEIGRADGTGRGPRSVADGASGVLDAVREGFERVTRDVPTGVGDEQDRRITAQVGVVLGLVYLAFLTVWFWATRLRWRTRV
jgi:hypothetical protein